ncbi:MAG: 30S ribosomal protein S16, partial [Anaerolineae bacterium]|nr:30S ribosomal protein S16 [Anaerolineae bacterium]
MVRIRLRRIGSKGQPSYRVVVADSRSPRDGRYIEVIGFYNPRTEPATMTIDEGRALHWLNVGAQPSETVEYILTANGTLDRFARMRKGETVEVLVAEAEEAAAARTVSAKTNVIGAAKPQKAAPAPAAEAVAETVVAEAVAEEVAEEEAEEEIEVEVEEAEA